MKKEASMKGTRPLDNDEIRRVSTCFTGTFEAQSRLAHAVKSVPQHREIEHRR